LEEFFKNPYKSLGKHKQYKRGKKMGKEFEQAFFKRSTDGLKTYENMFDLSSD
jgi:hypothetical protein